MRKQAEEKKIYNPQAIQELIEGLIKDRSIEEAENEWQFKMMPQITQEKIIEVIQQLPKEDAIALEEYFYLKGNGKTERKPKKTRKQLKALENKAIEAVRKLAQIKYLMIYDHSRVMYLISKIAEKIDKGNLQMTDVQCVQYLLAFVTIIQNGPKLATETNLMFVNSAVDRMYINEYRALLEMYILLKKYSGKPIKMQIIKLAFEMLDFKVNEEIKKKFGIPFAEETGMDIFFKDFEQMDEKDQEVLRRYYVTNTSQKMPEEILFDYSQIRAFKEKVFARGRWMVTTRLATGAELQTTDFKKEMEKISKCSNWTTILEQYKSEEKENMALSDGIKTFEMYEIGGLKFSDPVEIDLIYLVLKHGYV